MRRISNNTKLGGPPKAGGQKVYISGSKNAPKVKVYTPDGHVIKATIKAPKKSKK